MHKILSKQKVQQLLDLNVSKKIIRNASSNSINSDNLLKLFSQMLQALNINCKDEDAFGRIMTKASQIKSGNVEESKTIKIVSKQLKDSHYEVDVSKDFIKHNGHNLCMVSCYAKDLYLGRYIIKRNYFFSSEREVSANKTYDEVITKMASLKDRYYEEVIGIESITTQMKKILDGVISEISIEDDSLGTTVKR